VRFHPERWGKTYEHWLTNIRDWCISRQLWWGHRIPVYTCDACGAVVASVRAPGACAQCNAAAWTQDPDVLDTWFSSWLWPFATLGWPDPTRERALRLDRYFPSHVLVTAPEILFFWVARMIMASLRFKGAVPFADVYLHGIVRDGKGRKMSKSLGNSPDPIDLIDRSGADALRFTMMTLTPQGSDVLFDESKMDIGKHFANKVWNAARLVQSSIDGWAPPARAGDAYAARGDLDLPARWIRARFDETARDVSAQLARFEMLDATRSLHEFVWRDFCDWYLELAKPRVSAGADDATRAMTQRTLWAMLRGSMILLHPFMPFLTEEIWRSMPRAGDDTDSIVTARWPVPSGDGAPDHGAMTELQEIVRVIREIRAEMRVPPAQKVRAVLRAGASHAAGARYDLRDVALLAKCSDVSVATAGAAPAHAASGIAGEVEVFVPLEGVLDLEVERKRLEKEVARARKEVDFARSKLANADFVAKARPEVIGQQKEKLAAAEAALTKLKGYLGAVSA
jgi:valyl-tRNA synthetase